MELLINPRVVESLKDIRVNLAISIAAAAALPAEKPEMVTRWREKNPGLKILWIWTIGTAAVLITSVVRTRMRDVEEILRQEDEAAATAAAAAARSSAAIDAQGETTADTK